MPKKLHLDLNDIRSMTDFQRNAKTHLARLKRTKAPMVLTVNGSAAAVVQDAASYQQLVSRVEELEQEKHLVAAVNEGLAAVKRGDVVPLSSLRKR